MGLGEMKKWQLCDLNLEQGHAESKERPRDREETQISMGGAGDQMRREEILELELGMELGLGKWIDWGVGLWDAVWILTNGAVFQAMLVAQSFLRILNPCSVQLPWWCLILLLLQKLYFLGRALATARYSNNLFSSIIFFPFHD